MTAARWFSATTALQGRIPRRVRRPAALFPAALVAAALALAGCEQPVPPEAQACDLVRPALGFALNIPEGWTVRDLGGDVVVEIVAPDAPAGAGPAAGEPAAETRPRRPRAVVQVLVVEREGVGLDQWADEASAEMVEVQPDLAISARDASELADGREALLLAIENPRGVEPEEQRMLLAVTANRAYALIATASASEMAAVEPDLDVCLDSFIVW
jgi:hypothetical protein